MTTVVELDVPADRFGATEAFDRVPSIEFRLDGVIGDGPSLVWVSGPDNDRVLSALESDASITVVGRLAQAHEGCWLYRLEFGRPLSRFQRIVSEDDGVILVVAGRSNTWRLKVLFQDRTRLSAWYARVERNDFHVTVERVGEVDGPKQFGARLTETQYETIRAAHESGYFDVPRRITLEELAAELGVSHQALSERLRRSHAALVRAELSNRSTPTATQL